jgi:RimJ/RimL family protein N-acetyltransferase
MPAPDAITTKRLILRRAEERDAAAVVRLSNDRLISRRPYTGRDVQRILSRGQVPPAGCCPGDYLIASKGNPGLVMGYIRVFESDGYIILGYWTGRAYRNRGYASEACRAIVACTFDAPAVERIHMTCVRGNCASQRIIKKLGSRFIEQAMGYSGRMQRKVPVLRHVLERRVWARKTGK